MTQTGSEAARKPSEAPLARDTLPATAAASTNPRTMPDVAGKEQSVNEPTARMGCLAR